MKLLIEYRPTPRGRRPWVILMPAHPQPMVVGRTTSEELAREAVRVAGHEVES